MTKRYRSDWNGTFLPRFDCRGEFAVNIQPCLLTFFGMLTSCFECQSNKQISDDRHHHIQHGLGEREMGAMLIKQDSYSHS